MGNPVRLKILDELALGPLTLEDLSTRIALKTESIYHHIRILQQIGLVEEFEPVRSGGPGRPYARFKLTGKTVAIQYPQRNYYMFSEMLFQNLSDLFDADDLEARLKSIGKGIGENIAKTLSSQYEIDDWSLDKIRKYFVEGYLRNI
jgi:predicted ArsR family transcriptional regulator